MKYLYEYTYFLFQDVENGLSDVGVEVSGNKISCHFTKDEVTNLILPSDLGEATIDFDSVSYHIALAYGKLGGDGNVAKHSKAKVSDDPIQI